MTVAALASCGSADNAPAQGIIEMHHRMLLFNATAAFSARGITSSEMAVVSHRPRRWVARARRGSGSSVPAREAGQRLAINFRGNNDCRPGIAIQGTGRMFRRRRMVAAAPGASHWGSISSNTHERAKFRVAHGRHGDSCRGAAINETEMQLTGWRRRQCWRSMLLRAIKNKAGKLRLSHQGRSRAG